MRPGPHLASAAFLETVDIVANPRDAIEFLVELILYRKWDPSPLSARELAEKWNDGFLICLRRELSELNRIGRYSPFAFNSSSDYRLQGAAFIEPRDSVETQQHKRRRSRVRDYAGVLRALTPRQFETLCGGVLSVMNVEGLTVTPYSKDRGIDFHCQLPLERHIFRTDLHPNWIRQLKVWMVGQAKHYIDGKVSTSEIRELVGSIQLLRGPSSGRSRFENLVPRSCDPIFHLFFTTGRLSADCWEMLDESGVIGMDGEMLAAFMADREIGCTGSGFDESEFNGWIDGLARG